MTGGPLQAPAGEPRRRSTVCASFCWHAGTLARWPAHRAETAGLAVLITGLAGLLVAGASCWVERRATGRRRAQAKLLRTHKVRVDTAVVEAHVEYPADSGLDSLGASARATSLDRALFPMV